MFNFAYADEKGNAYESSEILAVGRLGASFVEPTEEEFIPMPEGSALTMIPGRTPIVMDIAGNFHKYKGEGLPLGALLPQGYTRTLLPAFINDKNGETLPLFGYAAVAFKKGKFYVAAIKTDVDDHWNPRHFNTYDLEDKVNDLKDKLPQNSIVAQLAHCALKYSCFTAQNIFYGRWEGGIPVSPVCNAQCVGCISLQISECCPSPQTRITAIPKVEEIVELGINHLSKGQDTIISFGQGCEGEPSLQGQLIAQAIKLIREKTLQGTINMNTNGGYTQGITQVVNAGIDSLRVSLNSATPEIYQSYYQPKNYSLEDVKASLKIAANKGTYTYLNLLFSPGMNDCEGEIQTLIELVQETKVKAIQLRNLNIDPDLLLTKLPQPQGEALGVPSFLEIIAQELPGVAIGNYTKPL